MYLRLAVLVSCSLLYNQFFTCDWQHTMHERECRVLIESDEEIEGGFACLIDEDRGNQ